MRFQAFGLLMVLSFHGGMVACTLEQVAGVRSPSGNVNGNVNGGSGGHTSSTDLMEVAALSDTSQAKTCRILRQVLACTQRTHCL